MVSTLSWFLHFSAEQTEAACCCPWPLCSGLWGRGWGRREGLLLGPVSAPHSHCTLPHQVKCWSIPVLLPFVVSQATNFKLCFYGNALKKMFGIVSGSPVFVPQRWNWPIILFSFFFFFHWTWTWGLPAAPCWAESRDSCICYRTFPKKTGASMCDLGCVSVEQPSTGSIPHWDCFCDTQL